ncbi:MAG: VOC family protein [Enterobacterales bacterium]|nr:VOC family protein [Enterobacterales bacterium]
MAKILGIGGIFFKSSEPKKLSKWYKQYMGLDIDSSFNGSTFAIKNAPENAYSVWSPFAADTKYFQPSEKDFMINFIVDDVEKLLNQAKLGGAVVHGSQNEEPFGLFGWFSDPDGNKIELWQPTKSQL